jgi:hypothetical protein
LGCIPVIPVLGKLRQEDYKFMVGLSYRAKPYLKNKKRRIKRSYLKLHSTHHCKTALGRQGLPVDLISISIMFYHNF